jgi:hypothetical protein
MKDRASGVYWKTVDLVWSGCVHWRDAALEGVIANAFRAGFPPCHPSCPAGAAQVQGPGGQVQAPTPGVGVDAGQSVRSRYRAAHMPSDNGAAIAFLRGDYDQLLRISCNGWRSRDRPPPAYESHSPRTIFSPTEGDNPSARVRQGAMMAHWVFWSRRTVDESHSHG